MARKKMSQNERLRRAVDTGRLGVGGGIMNRQQSNAFLNLVNSVAIMSPLVRLEIKDHPQGEISKLDITEPVTEGASENTDTGRVFEPEFIQMET